MPDVERVVDIARHLGCWFLLVRRSPTPERVGAGEFDVRVLEGSSPPRVWLSDCDGVAFVRGHLLTTSLALLSLVTGGSEGRLEPRPAPSFQQSVTHPTRVQKREMGWRGLWTANPEEMHPEERRAACVRELFSTREEPPPSSTLKPGPLTLDSELARALVGMRMLHEGNAEPTVSLAALLSAEAALGWALPLPVVILLASRCAYLEREWRLLPSELVHSYAAGRPIVPAGLRPFAVAHRHWLAVRGGPEDACFYLFDEENRMSIGPFEPLEWITRELSHVRERARQRWLGGDGHAGDLLRRERLLGPTKLTPAVVHEAAAAIRRVRHPKFGIGNVVAEEGRGDSLKLTLQFEDGTQRVVAARFVLPA